MDSALASCAGFAVHTARARVGTVEDVTLDPETGRAATLAISTRTGSLVDVPVEEVAEISSEGRRLLLRPGGLVTRPRARTASARAR